MVRIGVRRCKTIMSRSRIGSVDYSINPYIGCEHGCVYCYARFMSRLGHVNEEWGSFVDVKVNASQILRAEVSKRRQGRILLSSVTDPYQPLERRIRLTRELLRILLDFEYPIVIQTKSTLVLRDLDILTRFEDCEVGFTITTMDEDVRRVFEPRTSSVKERLKGLEEFHEASLTTYVFIGPLLPYLSDERLKELLDAIGDRADFVIFDRLNIKCGNLKPIVRTLNVHYPHLRDAFLEALSPSSNYYERLKAMVKDLCREKGLPYDFCY